MFGHTHAGLVKPRDVALRDRSAEVDALHVLRSDPDVRGGVGGGEIERDRGELEQADEQAALEGHEHGRERHRQHAGKVPAAVVDHALKRINHVSILVGWVKRVFEHRPTGNHLLFVLLVGRRVQSDA